MREELKQYEIKAEPFWELLKYAGGDGYDDMEVAAKQGWYAVPAWGKNGWDLGSWPYVIIFFKDQKDCYSIAEYCEGDITVYQCPTKEIREAITDEIAFFHWKHHEASWVEGIESVEQAPVHLRGPYSRNRTA